MTLLRFSFILLLWSCQIAYGDLQRQVETIVANSTLNKGIAGICIIDTGTKQTLVQINANKGMIPASNQKLLTTGAALHVLGTDFAFQTRLLLDDQNLIVVGDGDPTLGDTSLLGMSDWSTERTMLQAELKPWIDSVRSSGITSIETLYVDDRIFDRNFVHPSWPADQINNWYCAQIAGINYHLNVIHFFPSPNNGGRAGLGKYTPSLPWLTIENRTTSKTGKNSSSSFWVARSPNSNALTARGNVNSTHKEPVKVAIHDPSLIFGNSLAAELRRYDIAVGNIARVPDDAPPSHGKVIYLRSTPLIYALIRSNRDSHNLYAESLLKRLAASTTNRPGSFDEGSAVIETVVTQRIGISRPDFSVADGSGMSRDNTVSPMTLAMWLATFNVDEPAGQSLLTSLATPGHGTLKNRFATVTLNNATVHAKSGYLRGVCSLSGYVLFKNGRAPIVFSIFVNGVKGTVKGAKKMQELIVQAIVQSSY